MLEFVLSKNAQELEIKAKGNIAGAPRAAKADNPRVHSLSITDRHPSNLQGLHCKEANDPNDPNDPNYCPVDLLGAAEVIGLLGGSREPFSVDLPLLTETLLCGRGGREGLPSLPPSLVVQRFDPQEAA